MNLIIFSFASLIFLLGCHSNFQNQDSHSEIRAEVIIGSSKFYVEVASDDLARSKGLMFRESLEKERGMLFVYNDSEIRSFWMKNTLIPLDMLFIDEKGQIKKIRSAVPCETSVCESYGSEVPAKYVLEIRGGLAEEKGIKEGDRAEIRFV